MISSKNTKFKGVCHILLHKSVLATGNGFLKKVPLFSSSTWKIHFRDNGAFFLSVTSFLSCFCENHFKC